MLQQGLAFKGFTVEATDGKIGHVSDFLFDEMTWKLRWLVINTGNWLSERKLLLHPSAIDKSDSQANALLVKLTRAQVEQSPGIESDEPVSLHMEHRLNIYYGINPVQGGAYYGGNGVALPLSGAQAAGETANTVAADPHLRSLAEVTGYNIEASDGAIGHVKCFLIDDESWEIRYLVGDTANWWFGRQVLLSPASVHGIDWAEHKIHLNLTCYKIKSSPPWDPTGLFDRAYETLLHTYYDWPARHLPQAHAAHALPEPAQPATVVAVP